MTDEQKAHPPVPPTRVFGGGVLMGLANLVPGVSGGTMILAMGLYDQFIESIANATRLKLNRETITFLALIMAGAVITILGLSGVAVGLVTDYRWIMYSLFIGMTLGGAPELLRHCRPITGPALITFGLAFAGMAALAWGLAESRIEPSIPVFIGMGALAASSMILPGISGSYMLLIFGMYDTVIGSLSASALMEDTAESLSIIVPVIAGAALGMALLSNLLKHLLAKHSAASHAALLGLLVGSILGLWPFREPVHADLAQKPYRKAVVKVLAGDELAAINDKYGVEWSAAEATEIKTRYDGQSPSELKIMGDELKLFDPTFTDIAAALGLMVAGVTVTRMLGAKNDSDSATSPA
ncbi:MAG: putative membrane protein [Pseudohongiellaceae bacterium]|jgi:putative membrane protein